MNKLNKTTQLCKPTVYFGRDMPHVGSGEYFCGL